MEFYTTQLTLFLLLGKLAISYALWLKTNFEKIPSIHFTMKIDVKVTL